MQGYDVPTYTDKCFSRGLRTLKDIWIDFIFPQNLFHCHYHTLQRDYLHIFTSDVFSDLFAALVFVLSKIKYKLWVSFHYCLLSRKSMVYGSFWLQKNWKRPFFFFFFNHILYLSSMDSVSIWNDCLRRKAYEIYQNNLVLWYEQLLRWQFKCEKPILISCCYSKRTKEE